MATLATGFPVLSLCSKALGVIIVTLVAGVAAGREDGEVCESVGFFPAPNVTCGAACSQGCIRTTVTTNAGSSGVMCSCNIIGPPAVCCKIAWVASTMTYELVGDCALATCSASNCHKVFGVQVSSGEIVLVKGSC